MATYQHATVTSAASIRAIADGAGSHFFDRDTMRFFNSRILEGVYAAKSNTEGHKAVDGNVFFFVTSERYNDDPRHYTVRRMVLQSVRDGRPSVDIMTVEDSEHYSTANSAKNAAKAYAQES